MNFEEELNNLVEKQLEKTITGSKEALEKEKLTPEDFNCLIDLCSAVKAQAMGDRAFLQIELAAGQDELLDVQRAILKTLVSVAEAYLTQKAKSMKGVRH